MVYSTKNGLKCSSVTSTNWPWWSTGIQFSFSGLDVLQELWVFPAAEMTSFELYVWIKWPLLWTEYLCSSTFIVEILLPSVVALGGGTFRRCSCPQEWDQHPYKRHHSYQISLRLPPCEGMDEETIVYKPGICPRSPWICPHLNLGIPAFRIEK